MISRAGYGMRLPRGICQGCGNSRALRGDGTIRKHDEPDTLTTCSGSGQPPRPLP